MQDKELEIIRKQYLVSRSGRVRGSGGVMGGW